MVGRWVGLKFNVQCRSNECVKTWMWSSYQEDEKNLHRDKETIHRD